MKYVRDFLNFLQKNTVAAVGVILLIITVVFSIVVFSASVKKRVTVDKNGDVVTVTQTGKTAETEEKPQQNQELQQTFPAEQIPETTEKPKENTAVFLNGLKQYAENIREITADYKENRTAVNVSFKDAASLYSAFKTTAKSKIDVNAFFAFYLDDGKILKLPCETYFLKDKITVSFFLGEIEDYKEGAYLKYNDELNFADVLNFKKFNLVLTDKSGAYYTLFGNADYPYYESEEAKVSLFVKGIKKVETVKDSDFLWVDIYFTGAESYNNLNHRFKNNSVMFEYAVDNEVKTGYFKVTAYDELNMLRCKFNKSLLNSLNEECGTEYSDVSEFFKDVTVYSVYNKNKTKLFSF